jgi:hypothetical protein
VGAGSAHPAAELNPRGGDVSGSRHMLDKDGKPVEPRWKPAPDCEAAKEGALPAVSGTNVTSAVCPLVDQDTTPRPTAIEVDPASALGSLRCVDDNGSGDVASFNLLPEDAALPPVESACGSAPIPYDVGISPGHIYRFRLEAADKDGAVTHGTSCFVTAAEGRTARATCAPLSSRGALTVRPDALLASKGLACGPGATSYRVTLTGPGDGDGQAEPIESIPLRCGDSAFFSPLVPGAYTAAVEVRDSAGTSVATGSCAGDVRPGATTLADCPRAP